MAVARIPTAMRAHVNPSACLWRTLSVVAYRLLILDFDGTFTDAHAEARDYAARYTAGVAQILGRDVQGEWDEVRERMLSEPWRHGWRYNGEIAAPCSADPYLRVSCVAQLLFDQLGLLRDPDERSRVLEGLYRDSYAYTRAVPRSDAAAVLTELLRLDLAVAVVTNSPPEVVAGKLAALEVSGMDRVRLVGNARKFIIDPSPRDATYDGLEDLALPGLAGRSVLVKRGPYYDELRVIWDETGSRPDETLVVGDIFELDLALPLRLGAHVHLVHHRETPDYEVRFVASHPRGGVSAELSGVLARIRP